MIFVKHAEVCHMGVDTHKSIAILFIVWYNQSMQYSNIANIKASRLSLGCMRIADKPLDNIRRLVFSALDIGINLFDHADIYGGGSCEELFKQAIASSSSLRDKIVLQTKCGIRGGWYDLSYNHIIESVNGSLKRLGTDYIDILLLHRPDTLMRPEQIAKAFFELEKSGKVKCFGVSNFSSGQIDFLQSFVDCKLYVNQLKMSVAYCPIIDSGINVNTSAPEAYDRDGDILSYCRKNGITIQTYGSLQCEFTDDAGFFYNGAFFTDRARKKYFSLCFMLEGLAQKYGTNPQAVALAWILRHPANMQAIVGTTLSDRIYEYRDCCEIPITDYEWYKLYESAGHRIP